jgi:ribosomal protein L21E
MIQELTTGDRIRVDIPDETDPDHERYHGRHGTVTDVIEDHAAATTGDERDNHIYRVEFEDGTTADFRWRDLRSPFEE